MKDIRNVLRRPAVTFAVLACGLVLAALTLWLRGGNAAADAPPPELPPFEGEAVTIEYSPEGMETLVAEPLTVDQTGWQPVFREYWEDGLDARKWVTIDRDGTQNGEYKWGTRPINNPLGGGAISAWGVGGGANGSGLQPGRNGYPARVDSWLIRGPLDLSNTTALSLRFNYSLEADQGDAFSVLVSTNGSNWTGKQANDGGDGTWFGRSLPLNEYVGQRTVYIAFRFTSNETGGGKKRGAVLDDIVLSARVLQKQYLPHIVLMPTPTPTITPTPSPSPTPPGGNYFNDFTNNIAGWEARRWSNGADFSYQHRADSDGGRQGALEIEMGNTNEFVIVSPLVQAKRPPYNIEFMAKLKDPEDRQMYGVVFGANWNGQPCPTAGFVSCFTQYYELRVQYREFSGQRFQEIKLLRISSHSSSGEPEGKILIDWKKGANVGTDEWVEIDVNVSANGFLRVSFNNKFIAEAQDTAYLNNPYFGLMLVTKENDDARVKFDYFKID